MQAVPVETIAHYRIIEPIGAGGMGAVYKAYDNKLQRVVALKVLPPEYVSQQDRRRRFFQEARAASALTHPHILTVYEVGEDDGKPYIAMEYIEGETLRQKIKASALELKVAVEIAIQIAAGLARAHELGIIHRDLKPENLMLSRDGFAKILDFGLAKLVAERDRALRRRQRTEDADPRCRNRIRHVDGNGQLHGAGTVVGPTRGSPLRRVLVRRGPVRDADRQGAVRPRKSHRHDARDPASRTAVSRRRPPATSVGNPANPDQSARQDAEGTLPNDRRTRRRAETDQTRSRSRQNTSGRFSNAPDSETHGDGHARASTTKKNSTKHSSKPSRPPKDHC